MRISILAGILMTMIPGVAWADWPTLNGAADRNGQAAAVAVQDAARMTLTHTWALHSQISASPVVSGNLVFIACEDGNLHALDLQTGKTAWLFHAEGGIGSTPAISDGRIYFLSRDGFLQALSIDDGHLLWRFATGGERRFGVIGGYGLDPASGIVPDPWDFYLSSPLVDGDVVVFGSSDGHVYALDAANGRSVWTYDAGISVHSAPAMADGRIFIGTWDTRLLALDAATGRLLWQFQGGKDPQHGILQGIPAAPSVVDGIVYVGTRDGHVYAMDAASGKPRWTYDARGSWVVTATAVDAHTAYFATSDTALLVAVDRLTGAERYRSTMKVWTYASPVIAGDTLFAATMDGSLYALDAQTGAPVFHFQTAEGKADVGDIIDDAKGTLRTDMLFAPNAQLQASVERVKALGGFVASPVWDGGRLIAATATGDVLVFEERGKQ